MEQLRLCGIFNSGNTCYVNTVLQCFKSINQIEALCINKYNKTNNEHAEEDKQTIIYDMGHCYNLMVNNIGKVLKPSNLIRKIDGYIKTLNPNFNINYQGDIHEVLTYLLEKMINEIGVDCSSKKLQTQLLSNIIKYREQYNLVNKKYASYTDKCLEQWMCEFGHRYSPLVELVFRQDIKMISCSNLDCKYRSISFDNSSELELELPFNPQLKNISIYELINEYFETTYLNTGGDNNIEWKCEKCNQINPKCKKQRYIYKYPEILIINIKRFSFIPNKGFIKNPLAIDLDNDIIDFNKIINIRLDYQYELRSIGMHQGILQKGHYYTVIKNRAKDKSYFVINDETIMPINKINKQDAYVLIYELIKK